jgi:hypothetical protein
VAPALRKLAAHEGSTYLQETGIQAAGVPLLCGPGTRMLIVNGLQGIGPAGLP